MNGARVEIRWVMAALLALALTQCSTSARAEDVSQPAILQWFEATYDTMEKRSPDMFLAGYGRAYTPPPGRADLGNFSVGYDVYDRFDLGKPNNATLYGTETGLKQFANVLHRFDGRLDIDAVLNHNAYSDNDYVNPQFTQFQQAGGYPGFVLQNPDGGTDPARVLKGTRNGRLPSRLSVRSGPRPPAVRAEPCAPGASSCALHRFSTRHAPG